MSAGLTQEQVRGGVPGGVHHGDSSWWGRRVGRARGFPRHSKGASRGRGAGGRPRSPASSRAVLLPSRHHRAGRLARKTLRALWTHRGLGHRDLSSVSACQTPSSNASPMQESLSAWHLNGVGPPAWESKLKGGKRGGVPGHVGWPGEPWLGPDRGGTSESRQEGPGGETPRAPAHLHHMAPADLPWGDTGSFSRFYPRLGARVLLAPPSRLPRRRSA